MLKFIRGIKREMKSLKETIDRYPFWIRIPLYAVFVFIFLYITFTILSYLFIFGWFVYVFPDIYDYFKNGVP